MIVYMIVYNDCVSDSIYSVSDSIYSVSDSI